MQKRALGEPVEILQFGDKRLEVFQRHHVGPVGRSAVGVLMGLDEDAGDADRDRRPRQHGDELALSARGFSPPARLLDRMGGAQR